MNNVSPVSFWFCNKDDYSVYRIKVVGDNILKGMGKGRTGSSGGDNRDVYLQLSVTILAAFSRIPEIASSPDMVSKIPLVLEIMSEESGSLLLEECYEFLLLVSTANDDGVITLYKSGGLNVLATHMSTFPDGSHAVKLGMRLFQLILSKLPLKVINREYPAELSMVVAIIGKQFAVLHDTLKFEALHLLTAVLHSKDSAPVHDALRLMENDVWSTYIRIGVVAILQNRVAPAERLQALMLAESVISIVGEGWLIESSRVEVAVLLNELGYLKYEGSKDSSSNAEAILSKQRNLGVAFSLVEKIIKIISRFSGEDESHTANIISERTFTKIISGLDETIGVVLEYLQDAKVHGEKKGDDLLASVRIAGSYLAQAPLACKEKVGELIEYLLSIEGEDETSPFCSICFMLPMLCQTTMGIDGCKVLAFSGAYKAVVDCLIRLISPSSTIQDDGSISLACDTIMNFLLKREHIRVPLDDSTFVRLLVGLSSWAEESGDPSIIMMASSICALIFDSTSEEALLHHPDFDNRKLISLYQVMRRSLALCCQ
ncbi:hypothetical protein RJ640_015097, partial [Escallonia rubra]